MNLTKRKILAGQTIEVVVYVGYIREQVAGIGKK